MESEPSSPNQEKDKEFSLSLKTELSMKLGQDSPR
jgi:hypothetical protein